MKLSALAREPQLIRLVIDDEDVIKEYGEPLEFWTWDRQPMDVFLKLAGRDEGDRGAIMDLVRTLVLDDTGKMIIDGGAALPSGIMMRVLARVVEQLGK